MELLPTSILHTDFLAIFKSKLKAHQSFVYHCLQWTVIFFCQHLSYTNLDIIIIVVVVVIMRFKLVS